MLRVLALDPTQPDAAKTLREIERRRFTRIQADRAAKVTHRRTQVAIAARMRAQSRKRGQRRLRPRAGDRDVPGRRREPAACAISRPSSTPIPGNRAARQRIGTVVSDRARELEDQGAREQALRCTSRRSRCAATATAPWAARIPALKKTLSQEYFDKGTRAYRTNLAQAITFFETSLRYDPANTQARAQAARTRRPGAREARQDRARNTTKPLSAGRLPSRSGCAYFAPNFSLIFLRRSSARSRSSFAFWLSGSSASTRSHLLIASSRFCRWNACVASRS